MRIVLQRVKSASVSVEGKIVGKIGRGLLLLVGAGKDDKLANAEYLADKCVGLRIFEDDAGKMNLSVRDIGGEVLVVSQFTLCADVSKGRRPSFDTAMEPEAAESLYKDFCQAIAEQGIKVATGTFGAKMAIELINDGPVTFVLDK